ncbi:MULTISPECIES: hypothetical protein [Olivibacter]|uniref:Lipoprotein n=1 Tax=Olivibacter jilunii TaxID=985016 RepID=A0ABW6B3E9_9SPHI|nr:hypothetical protein [Olivibacter sp. UJ_SKK_5.1]MDX3916543.1 hypothetical protein [Pseudosphingobacterium sp.]
MKKGLVRKFPIIIIPFMAMNVIAFLSCSNQQKRMNSEDMVNAHTTNSDELEVPYVLAENYFVRNDFDETSLSTPKISSREEFDKIFGMATVMGDQGKPTPIDFTKQFAIAVISPADELAVKMKAVSLQKKEGHLLLRYKQDIGAKLSMKIQPFLLLVVDKKFDGQVAVEEEK